MTGEEIAWHTLAMERVEQPCIIASWCMKREFFRAMIGRQDIYADAPAAAAQAYVRAGANLCPQFIMPSPHVEHLACDPFRAADLTRNPPASATKSHDEAWTAERIRDYIEALPDIDALERDFDIESAAADYARRLARMGDLAPGEMLFIGMFAQPDFMGGYTRWGFDSYLLALGLYPKHLERYYAHSGEQARLHNVAIAEAIQKHNLAPFVYGGQDICFNDGPMCSPELLSQIYFPHLASAVEPLHAAGVRIIWHCDGDIRPILDELIHRIGVAGLQGFQEETGCTLEQMASARTREGAKLILWGSVSVTTTLPFGTVEDVRRDVERCFRVGAPGGGFALASTSSILPETPLENILAMFQHARQFGHQFLAGS